MKYVNAVIYCYDNSVSQYLFGGPLPIFLNKIRCKYSKKTKQFRSSKFGIVLFLNIRGSELEKLDNPVVQKKRLEFTIRLTRVSDIPEEQICYNLANFIIDLSDTNILSHGQFDCVDTVKSINVQNLEIPTLGRYIVKVLVREEGQELYDIQSVYSVTFQK